MIGEIVDDGDGMVEILLDTHDRENLSSNDIPWILPLSTLPQTSCRQKFRWDIQQKTSQPYPPGTECTPILLIA